MKTPFKLKSGNTTPFKQMGAEIPLHSATTLEEKALQSKIAKEYKLPVSKKGSMPKDFNITGSKASTTPGYSTTKLAKSKLPKDFNITGSSKAGKFAKVSKKPVSRLGGVIKGLQTTPEQFATKAKTKMLKQVAKKGVGRLVGAAFGPGTALAGMAYGAYKSGQKHSGGKAVKGQKSFMAESKKKTKSIYSKKK